MWFLGFIDALMLADALMGQMHFRAALSSVAISRGLELFSAIALPANAIGQTVVNVAIVAAIGFSALRRRRRLSDS